ncbi:MAG: hypothetical protein CR988_07120 [Treponema sp.]|nr:MAG: hypothetical protein CR988_07120 [Treponema sp.]
MKKKIIYTLLIVSTLAFACKQPNSTGTNSNTTTTSGNNTTSESSSTENNTTSTEPKILDGYIRVEKEADKGITWLKTQDTYMPKPNDGPKFIFTDYVIKDMVQVFVKKPGWFSNGKLIIKSIENKTKLNIEVELKPSFGFRGFNIKKVIKAIGPEGEDLTETYKVDAVFNKIRHKDEAKWGDKWLHDVPYISLPIDKDNTIIILSQDKVLENLH